MMTHGEFKLKARATTRDFSPIGVENSQLLSI